MIFHSLLCLCVWKFLFKPFILGKNGYGLHVKCILLKLYQCWMSSGFQFSFCCPIHLWCSAYFVIVVSIWRIYNADKNNLALGLLGLIKNMLFLQCIFVWLLDFCVYFIVICKIRSVENCFVLSNLNLSYIHKVFYR